MARFINDTIRPFRNAIKSYTNSYFYTTDSIDVRFHVEGVLSDDNKSGLTNDTYRGKRYIYDGNSYEVDINMPQGIAESSLTNGDIIEFQSNDTWQAVWSSQGITSDEYPDSDYTSIGTFVYNKETENILVFNGSLWKEIQPASSLQVTTPDFTGDNTSTLNFFGHTGSKNLVLSGDGTDGTANVELNSPFSSKYFFGPSAPDQSTTPINFGDRWYSTEIGSELVWIPNLPENVLFEAGTTFAKVDGGTFAADTSNISFIGQDGKSYIVPETEFSNYVSGNYDLANSESLTGVWVMIPIAGGGDGSLSEIIVDGITYPSVSSLNFGSGNNVTLDSSIDGSSLSLTFGIDISTVVGPTGPTGVDGSTGNTGVVGTISAGGNSVVDAQFLSFEDGGIITASSLTSDSGITVTYSATLAGATGIYVRGSEIGLSADVEDLNNVAPILSGGDGNTLPPGTGSTGEYFYLISGTKVQVYEYRLSGWVDISEELTPNTYYFWGETTQNLYYLGNFSGTTFDKIIVTDPQPLVYDPATSKYVRKAFRLDDIADVTAGSPSDGYYLQYNDSTGKWEPGAPPDLDGITGQVDIFVEGVTYPDQEIIAFTGQDGANGIPITRVKKTEDFGTMGSLLEFGLSGAPHSLFPDNAFKTNTSATGHAKKVLTLNDDGTIGWEYLRNYDVVDPDKFTFGINSFSFEGIDTTVLAGPTGTTHFDQGTTTIATYNGVVTETSISETSVPSVGTFEIDGFPRSVTSTEEFSVLWPESLTGYNGSNNTLGLTNRTKITFTLSATGTFDGITANDTRNRVVVYANNIYAGYPVGSIPELVASQNDLGPSGIDGVQTFAEASWNQEIDSYNTDSNYTVSSINNKPIKDLGIGEDFLDSSVGGNTKYFYIMWPERYGFQIHQPTNTEVCEFAIFKNFTQSETSNTSFFVSGLTVANKDGFEERYVLYRLPNGDASNWKVELVPSLGCSGSDYSG